MRYLVKILRKALAALSSGQPRNRHCPVPETAKRTKSQALSASAILPLIDRLPKAKVVRVCDGDTVLVAKGRAEIVVRLDSIDCPEAGQEWGDMAKFGLIKLIGGRHVHLEEHGLDDYGRTLATVYVQHHNGEHWTNVNERMVTLGHAWVMRRYYDHLPSDRRDNRIESWARTKKVGLWRSPNPIPPWQWRSSMMQ
jgi:endonuclease YncB( thermonuclease family)